MHLVLHGGPSSGPTRTLLQPPWGSESKPSISEFGLHLPTHWSVTGIAGDQQDPWFPSVSLAFRVGTQAPCLLQGISVCLADRGTERLQSSPSVNICRLSAGNEV